MESLEKVQLKKEEEEGEGKRRRRRGRGRGRRRSKKKEKAKGGACSVIRILILKHIEVNQSTNPVTTDDNSRV